MKAHTRGAAPGPPSFEKLPHMYIYIYESQTVIFGHIELRDNQNKMTRATLCLYVYIICMYMYVYIYIYILDATVAAKAPTFALHIYIYIYMLSRPCGPPPVPTPSPPWSSNYRRRVGESPPPPPVDLWFWCFGISFIRFLIKIGPPAVDRRNSGRRPSKFDARGGREVLGGIAGRGAWIIYIYI